jgi:outer membrane lipoprotein-sorting protein
MMILKLYGSRVSGCGGNLSGSEYFLYEVMEIYSSVQSYNRSFTQTVISFCTKHVLFF